ncbi:hypothetical protein JQ597_19470 [Bradyrhizobium sp. AUGA SZCCT0177]|uniref:hypothetical protein n=1 Tax=Bradyrhizobium sp. AUGA SZCCT0177 TaxID=2807665 RepID=UPI001BA4F0E3|nr:hypothetical protein [Bradyrhizobium sp. AUGA SZCCT0177]MBR1284233.1 hypothetical protein [Bradyrhizobium sp. AUGA SZCCT0177]
MGAKKQGRRRSIPSTTLPAPDIEIGSRHPVNCSMQEIPAAICEAVHTRNTKLAGRRIFGGIWWRAAAGLQPGTADWAERVTISHAKGTGDHGSIAKALSPFLWL